MRNSDEVLRNLAERRVVGIERLGGAKHRTTSRKHQVQDLLRDSLKAAMRQSKRYAVEFERRCHQYQ